MKNMCTQIRRNIETMTKLSEIEIALSLGYSGVKDMRRAMAKDFESFTMNAISVYGPKAVDADGWCEAACVLDIPEDTVIKSEGREVITPPKERVRRKNTMNFELNEQTQKVVDIYEVIKPKITRYSENWIPCPTKAEMEFCSNLITTMVNKGASEEEIKRVITYSMTVIDANKMQLNWLEARKSMGIDELVSKYGLYMKQKMNREDIVDAE